MCSEHGCPVACKEHVRSEHVCPVARKEHIGPVACKEHIFPESLSEQQTDCVCTQADAMSGLNFVSSCKVGPDMDASGVDDISSVDYCELAKGPVELSDQVIDDVTWPLEPGGCSDFGEAVVFVDVITQERDVTILNCGVSQGTTGGVPETPSSWGFSVDELKEAQEKDNDLELIIEWLRTATQPGEGVLFLSSPATKSYWLNKEQFVLIEGVLYRNRDDSDEKDLVMPESLREQALEWNHDIPSAGHQGVVRTKARMKEKFFWYGMGAYITKYVLSCAICSQNKKATNYGHFGLKAYQASAPMERVHIDFMGPLPRTPRGNEHILMMVDQFTKWVECVPLPSQTAEVTAKVAVDQFFSRFGYPFQIFSDQGRNFESKLFAALCKALHIHKTRTTPYRPSANGQVERYNRTLMDAVRCYIQNSQNQWDLHIQQIAGALRGAVNQSTGFTANKLLMGREVNIPAYLMFPQRVDKKCECG